MRYTLWSHGRLVGHTDLDIATVTSTMRQGFVEPTEQGKALLADATGVWRAIAQMKRERRARGEGREKDDHSIVLAAMERREALDLELRDEAGSPFECAFIRITDNFDVNNGVVDEMSETEEEEEAEFEVKLSALSGEERERALAQRDELNASIQADVEAIMADFDEAREEREKIGTAPPEDPRWDTMQYLLQAHLGTPAWDRDDFADFDLPL